MNRGAWVTITVDPMGVVNTMTGPFKTARAANDFIERHPKKFAELHKTLNERIPHLVADGKSFTYTGYVNDPFWDTYPD